MKALALAGMAAAVMMAASTAIAQSIHLMPPGTLVRGQTVLVGKTVPLPEGEFVLVAAHVRDAQLVRGEWVKERVKLVDVYLAQLQGERLASDVIATTVLDPNFTYSHWEDEPCKRDDTLFRRDLGRNPGYQQNCLLVNHIVNIYSKAPSGIYAEAYTWLRRHNVQTPVDVVVEAAVTRIEVGEYLTVRHRFNPEAFGCRAGRTVTWASSAWHPKAIVKDEQRMRFANSVIEWGKALQSRVDADFQRKAATPIASAGAIYRCS